MMLNKEIKAYYHSIGCFIKSFLIPILIVFNETIQMRPDLASLVGKREKHAFEIWLRGAHIKKLGPTAHMLFQIINFFVLSFWLNGTAKISIFGVQLEADIYPFLYFST